MVHRLAEHHQRRGGGKVFSDNLETLLLTITDAMKHNVQAQYLKRQQAYAKSLDRSLDDSTVTSRLLAAFDERWKDINTRLDMVSGKEVLSRLNERLQEACSVTVTPTLIIEAMMESEVASEMKGIISSLENFAKGTTP